jgi:hypothetical protein
VLVEAAPVFPVPAAPDVRAAEFAVFPVAAPDVRALELAVFPVAAPVVPVPEAPV